MVPSRPVLRGATVEPRHVVLHGSSSCSSMFLMLISQHIAQKWHNNSRVTFPRTDGLTDGRTNPLIEMRERIIITVAVEQKQQMVIFLQFNNIRLNSYSKSEKRMKLFISRMSRVAYKIFCIATTNISIFCPIKYI